MKARGLRRMALDLTPCIDVIMILLFGVMINSAERSKVDTVEYRVAADRAISSNRESLESLKQLPVVTDKNHLSQRAECRGDIGTRQRGDPATRHLVEPNTCGREFGDPGFKCHAWSWGSDQHVAGYPIGEQPFHLFSLEIDQPHYFFTVFG